MEWSVTEELVAQAIGREAVKCIESEKLASMVNRDVMRLLEEIRNILDDDRLDDPECFQKIEAIVTTFHQHGISTSRHDFG